MKILRLHWGADFVASVFITSMCPKASTQSCWRFGLEGRLSNFARRLFADFVTSFFITSMCPARATLSSVWLALEEWSICRRFGTEVGLRWCKFRGSDPTIEAAGGKCEVLSKTANEVVVEA